MSQPAPILSIEKHFRYGMNAKEELFNKYFKEWQTREPQWKNRLGDGWKISKTLGAGAGGGASLVSNICSRQDQILELEMDCRQKYLADDFL